MADSKLSNIPAESSDVDLVQCGICYAIIDKPKALPCLHTFCLKCLSSWSESAAKKTPDKYAKCISCPNCREEFPLPKGGVKDLRTNFFVNKLKERNSIQKKLFEKDAKIPCTSCDPPSENQAIGRCVECSDFLCKMCAGSHATMRVLKHHHVLSLEELRAGKLSMGNIPEQGLCSKHEGEVLRFYCETCDEPMCRDCTVIDHPRPDHKQLDLTSASEERTVKLRELFTKTKPISQALNIAIVDDETTLKELNSNVEEAIRSYQKTSKQAKSDFTQKMRKLQAKRIKEIEAHLDSLQFQKSRLCNALEITKQVTAENGSRYDVAMMYKSLVGTIQGLSKTYPKSVRKSIGQVEFSPVDNLRDGLVTLGTLNDYWQWVLDKTITSDPQYGTGFSDGKYIILDTNGNIAVSTFSNNSVRIMNNNGQNVHTFKTGGVGGSDQLHSACPWGIAIGKDGTFFITDQNPYVKVFDSRYNFKRKFEVKLHPNGKCRLGCSHGVWPELMGLTIDHKDHVYIGCTNKYYVSIHEQDGSHVSSFHVNLAPYFIAVTHEDHMIVSGYKSQVVHVYDIQTTSQLYTFAAPPGGKFYPSGLCIVDDEVFVASCQGVPAVYRYSFKGEYIGIVTKDVSSPWGITLTDDGEELLVCNGNTVKVFHLK